MSLRIQKRSWKKQDGTTTSTWRLIVEIWEGDKRAESIYPPKTHYGRYGLDPEDPYETAKTKLRAVSAQRNAKRLAEKKAKIGKKMAHEELKESAYLPRQTYQDFLDWIKERRLWDEIPDKIQSHLKCMRKVILQVNIDPSEWPDKPEKIYRFFMTEKLSLSYLDKVLPLMNDYGYFYCREFKKPYLPIKPPLGELARRIDDANLEDRKGSQAPSAPITPKLLSKLKNMGESHLRWMRLSVWFGLRPSEIDQLKPENRKKIWDVFKDPKGTKVLSFYQSKLTRLERARRWKRIPAILKEQKELLVEIEKGLTIQRPLLKSIEKRIGGEFGLYGGRKGFQKLMQSHKQKNDNISRWLGHRDVKMTEDHYRDLELVEYDLVVEKQT